MRYIELFSIGALVLASYALLSAMPVAADSRVYTDIRSSADGGGSGNAHSSVSVTTTIDGKTVTDLHIEGEEGVVATTSEVHTDSGSSYTNVRIETEPSGVSGDSYERYESTETSYRYSSEEPTEVHEEAMYEQKTESVDEDSAAITSTITSSTSLDAAMSESEPAPRALMGTVATLMTRILHYVAFIFS